MATSKKVTIGAKVLREELPAMKQVAVRLGYKNLSQWLETMLRREYTKAVSELLDPKAVQNVQVQPSA